MKWVFIIVSLAIISASPSAQAGRYKRQHNDNYLNQKRYYGPFRHNPPNRSYRRYKRYKPYNEYKERKRYRKHRGYKNSR